MNDAYDIVIIGGGPAGLTAGLYAARSRLKAVLLERMGFGGQLLTYERVDNYPGFPEGISAFGLAEPISAQALKFGLENRTAEVVGLEFGDRGHTVSLADGKSLKARAIIIASGASPRKLAVRGEKELTGRGVSYCAVCDAPFYRDQDVAVIGGGDTAIEEAIYLTKFASRVYIIHRRDRLRATPVIQEKALRSEKISFLLNTVVTEVQGGAQGVEKLLLKSTDTGVTSELLVGGAFVFVGIRPNTEHFPPEMKRDPMGFIHTDQEMPSSVPGVFAAGDVRVKDLRQIVTSVGDGATAAFCAGRYIENTFS
jgi:thioredoxin reductase (NADPH)